MTAERLGPIVSTLALLVTGLAVLAFGVIVAAVPGSPEPFYRSIGVASIGMGLFGVLLTVYPFRRRVRWAWLALWYYPIFWAAHLVANLPPGQDHIHQVVFVALALVGLLLPVRDFFPGAVGAA